MSTLYLITGAAGFLGSHICSSLLSRGDRVRGLVLPEDDAAKHVPQGVEIIEGSILDVPSLERFFAVPAGTETFVLHCEGLDSDSPDFSQKLLDVNVTGTKNVIEQCLRHPECRKLVYVSSAAAVPELPKGQLIAEPDQYNPEDASIVGFCAKTRAMASQAVLDAVKERGLSACIVLPAGILGPGDYAVGGTTRTVINIMTGRMNIGMGGTYNLADVRDLAEGCIAALDKGANGQSYILANREITMKEMCRLLHDASGCRTPYVYVPIWMAWKLADQMEKKAKKTGEKPVMTHFAVYELARNNVYDCSKAEVELGYSTRPYADTLRDMAKWLADAGLVPRNKKAEAREKKAAEAAKAKQAEKDEIKLTSGRSFVEAVAGVKSKEKLRVILSQAGINGVSEENLDYAYKAIALSQKWSALQGIFADKDYESCSAKLAEYGVYTDRDNFDLINEVISVGSDDALLAEVTKCKDMKSAVDVLAKHGYTAMSEDFLREITEEAAMMREDTFFTDEDTANSQGATFNERCSRSINVIFALSAIIGLSNGFPLSAEPVLLIAIATGMSFMA